MGKGVATQIYPMSTFDKFQNILTEVNPGLLNTIKTQLCRYLTIFISEKEDIVYSPKLAKEIIDLEKMRNGVHNSCLEQKNHK
jgi:hypothetical protein